MNLPKTLDALQKENRFIKGHIIFSNLELLPKPNA
jgi:hypothetical protein